MYINTSYYKKYLPYTKFFLILFALWLSLNTGSKYIKFFVSGEYILASAEYIILLDEYNLDFLINLIRSLLPYLLIIYLLFTQKKFIKNFILNLDPILKIIMIYGLLQLIGLVYYGENFEQHYWVVCLFSVILFYQLVYNKNDEKLVKYIFFLNIVAIFIVFTLFTFLAFKKNINESLILYDSKVFLIYFMNEEIPRAGGLSRMGLILFIFLNSIFFSKIFSNRTNFVIFFLNILILTIIFMLQSRTSILALIIIFLFINFIYKFQNYRKRFIYNFFLILIPIFLFSTYPILKKIIIKNEIDNINIKDLKKIENQQFGHLLNKQEKFVEDNKFIYLRKKKNLENESLNIYDKLSNLSNNRIDAWNFLIQIFFTSKLNDKISEKLKRDYDIKAFYYPTKKNLLTGYGPQADRKLMTNKTKITMSEKIQGPFGWHASNGYVYSLICSGIIGLLLFIILNIIILFKIYKIILYKSSSSFNSNPFLSSAVFCLLFLQLRVFLENSFSVFGVDLLILLSAYQIIQNEYRKLNN